MMGVPLDDPANLFCGNAPVVINASCRDSISTKKHVATCYHQTREACACGMLCVAKGDGTTNLADMLTRCVDGPRLNFFIQPLALFQAR